MSIFRVFLVLFCCCILVGCESPQELVPWSSVPDDAFHKLVCSLDRRVNDLRQQAKDKQSTIGAITAYHAPAAMDTQFIWREGKRAQKWDRRFCASTYNFHEQRTVGSSSYGTAVHIEYGSPKDKQAKLQTVGDPCLIRDLGPVDFRAVQLPQEMTMASVAVEPAKGNTYIIHIKAYDDLWAKMTVIDMVKDEWIIFRWQRLPVNREPRSAS